MNRPSRREVLLAGGATVIADAVRSGRWGNGALAQQAPTAGQSGWRYRSTVDLAAALKKRDVSAVELLDEVIARVEALDGRLNAVVVRDFERARAAAKAADLALARGERRPLLGIPMTMKESLQHRRPADDLGHSPVQGLSSGGGRRGRRAAEGGGRGHRRQNQCADRAGRLAELQRDLRHHQQSLGPRPHAGRIFRRLGGGAGGRLRGR